MKVLIADDSISTRKLVEKILVRQGYDVVVASNGNDAWQHLVEDSALSLAILDWMMPGLDGIDICARIRNLPPERFVYALLLTSKNHKDDIVRGLDAGADDYVVKPFNHEELTARLRIGQRLVESEQCRRRALEDLNRANQELRMLAATDPLTGLLNHGAILAEFEREAIRASRERRSLGVMMADIDHFKHINDTNGHLAGDVVLREVAHRIRSVMRPYDAIGRYGGEEFLILHPGISAARHRQVAERARQAVESLAVDVGSGTVRVTISAGIALLPAGTQSPPELALKLADEALYQAKNEGRNRVAVANAFTLL